MSEHELQDLEDPPEEQNLPDPRPALTIVVNSWWTPIVGILMLVVGLLGGYFGRPLVARDIASDSPTPQEISVEQPQSSSAQNPNAVEIMNLVTQQTRHFIGSQDAPVTIIEFSDFQCSYCGRFATGAGRQIIEQYVETGKVRFGYIHFAFLGPGSLLAAQASECAADQEAFWPYHDLVFENQRTINENGLKTLAGGMGLDEQAFAVCLDSGKHEEFVSSQNSFSRSIGVQSTPSFLVNGQPVIGAQDFEVFQQIIEAELSAASK
jgi:protein-disulfide isomerase